MVCQKGLSLSLEDKLIRDFIKDRLRQAGISRVEIERKPQEITLIVHAASAWNGHRAWRHRY